MEKVIHSANKSYPFGAYNFLSFVGMTALTSETRELLLPYFYQHHISLSSKSLFALILADYIWFDDEEIYDHKCCISNMRSAKEIQDSFCQHLLEGYYINVMLDEYYLNHSEAYHRYHDIRDMLIYGLDTDRHVFYTAAYDKSGFMGYHCYDIDTIIQSAASIVYRETNILIIYLNAKKTYVPRHLI